MMDILDSWLLQSCPIPNYGLSLNIEALVELLTISNQFCISTETSAKISLHLNREQCVLEV